MPKSLDDLDEFDGAETRTHMLQIDDIAYEVELTPENYDTLLDMLNPWLKKARKINRTR
ncbi:Lsr2 dimerization domain-containing protein [Streptomyces sp. NRRL S-244]|uniref:Lsr2 dimerization domain-containing protein n=1 Tax=Streptomyces sp. NRRL S-244 TaxID=1463897 RepID=UPI000998429E|nr:histone-like nucleoid-structuring protein Lsr2 [Streptomyces sp. NRRL S-244]